MARGAAVETKDDPVEIALRVLGQQAVADATRPSPKVGEHSVDPGRHHMGCHRANDEQLAIVAAAGSYGRAVVPGLERQRGLVDLNKKPSRCCDRDRSCAGEVLGQKTSAAIGTHAELLLELQCGDAVGVYRHQAGGPNADGEHQLAAMHDGSRRHRGLAMAARVFEGVRHAAQCPSRLWPRPGHVKPWPSRRRKPGGARVIFREHALEDDQAIREVIYGATPFYGIRNSTFESPANTAQHLVSPELSV